MKKQEIFKTLQPAFNAKAARMGYFIGDNEHKDSQLITFHKGRHNVFSLMPNGSIHYNIGNPFYNEFVDLTETLMQMKEAYEIFLNAEPLEIAKVSDFRVLLEYGKILLAARMEKDQSLHFVTWIYGYDRSEVMWGNYFDDNYVKAKQDFAVRAGLINEIKLFSKEELTVLHNACVFRGKNDEEIPFREEKKLQGVMEKIEENIPSLIIYDNEVENENGLER